MPLLFIHLASIFLWKPFFLLHAISSEFIGCEILLELNNVTSFFAILL